LIEFVIIISISLLAKLVECVSMAYLLSTRVSLVQIVITQITVLISGLFIVYLITFLAGFIVANLSIDSAYTIAFLEFFQINFVGALLFVGFVSYLFFFSALFNAERFSFALAFVIIFLFYALDMFRKIL